MKVILEDYEKKSIASLAKAYSISQEKLEKAFEETLDVNFDDLLNDLITNHIEEILQEA